MLELRPSCEHCNIELPPNSLVARICSLECTFCETCADQVLHNVCPNCGGGFERRPIRPNTDWQGGNFLGTPPASSQAKHRPVDISAHEDFSAALRLIPPAQR